MEETNSKGGDGSKSSRILWKMLTEYGVHTQELSEIHHSPTVFAKHCNVEITGRTNPKLVVKKSSAEEFNNDTLVLISHKFCDIYYHWLFDILPLAKLITQNSLANKILLPSPKFTFQSQWLKIVNCSLQIVFLEDHVSQNFKTIFVPTPSTTNTLVAPWALQSIIAETELVPPKFHSKRIYLRRSGEVKRKIINENELESKLSTFGFEAYDAAKMSAADQISLLKGAEIVISAHGSSLANIAFCKPETIVIEIFGPCGGETCYPRMAAGLQLMHIGVQAKQIGYLSSVDKYKHEKHESDAPFHFYIEINLVLKALDLTSKHSYTGPEFI